MGGGERFEDEDDWILKIGNEIPCMPWIGRTTFQFHPPEDHNIPAEIHLEYTLDLPEENLMQAEKDNSRLEMKREDIDIGEYTMSFPWMTKCWIRTANGSRKVSQDLMSSMKDAPRVSQRRSPNRTNVEQYDLGRKPMRLPLTNPVPNSIGPTLWTCS